MHISIVIHIQTKPVKKKNYFKYFVIFCRVSPIPLKYMRKISSKSVKVFRSTKWVLDMLFLSHFPQTTYFFLVNQHEIWCGYLWHFYKLIYLKLPCFKNLNCFKDFFIMSTLGTWQTTT